MATGAQSDGSWAFQNQNSGLCLDVYGAGNNAGQQLDQWPCKNAAGAQPGVHLAVSPAADVTAAVGNAGRSGRRATRRRPAFRPTALGRGRVFHGALSMGSCRRSRGCQPRIRFHWFSRRCHRRRRTARGVSRRVSSSVTPH
ncbi:RICIN domain-containing protein [Actinoallomurus sp. NBC_01490]|uniref:RICIN domain-containing protein n=1 Tax=Actinoallomurus sp. NBC_01490 TaxID=2903557 RepID=UPI003FA43B06